MEDMEAKETDALLDKGKQPNEMYSVNFNSKDLTEKVDSKPRGSGYWTTVSNMMKSSIGNENF